MNIEHKSLPDKACDFFNRAIAIAATRFVACCDCQTLCRMKEELKCCTNAPESE